jgi:hypothetical protein
MKTRVTQLTFLCLLWASCCSRAQLTFTTNDGGITITGYNGTPIIVNIPSTTNGYQVNNIAEAAFMWNGFTFDSTLLSITIPDGVTNIGAWAFADNYNLTNAPLPDTVVTVGEYTEKGSNHSFVHFKSLTGRAMSGRIRSCRA